jgi:DNA polymerase
LIWPAALAAEAAGYPVVLTVYDEIVVEPPEGFGSLKELEQIVIDATPEFAKSWPIRVDGWEGDRYKK